MFQIIITGTGQELRQTSCCLLNQFLIGINGENCFDTLIGYSKWNVVTGLVGSFEGLLDDGVAVLGSFGVTFTQQLQNF